MQKEVNFRYQKFWKKIRKCRKRPFRSSCRKDCKSSVSNGNMQKQDGWDRQRKPQRKQWRSPGIFYSGSQKDTGDCVKECFASACNRSICGASCHDYDSSILLWSDVCRRNQYHAGRKLYERSGRNRCG